LSPIGDGSIGRARSAAIKRVLFTKKHSTELLSEMVLRVVLIGFFQRDASFSGIPARLSWLSPLRDHAPD
jgi:hypothetical protein